MSLTIHPTPEFSKSVKKLFKRYKQIAKDLLTLEKELQDNPEAGIDIGHHCYKLRLANSSVPTGKSGGFRVIYFLRKEKKIYLLAIYSKSDLENLEEKKLLDIMFANDL
ncbi:MAG: type II toxin-antitoxin system RelE/ParE family toxin [Epsilonproteobacteria bacterium]|nr:type II toxin-antitoxin system RelE/ParE family toxin [Campylobacterota bacterium]